MDTTMQAVCDDARALLNDVDIPTGEFATNAALKPHRERAYREMFNVMGAIQSARIERVIYWILNPYSSLLSPVGHIGLADFAEPVFVEERDGLNTATIATTGTSSPIRVITTAPHNLADNQEVTVMGVSGTTAPWGRWYVTVVDAANFNLNNSISDGVAGTGGTVCWSDEKFTEVEPLKRETDRAISDRLVDYFWDEGVFKFRGATAPRQLRITYRASGNPPTQVNQPLGIDDCLNFLGCRTASLLADAKGFAQRAQQLKQDALGPKMAADGSGGFLRDFLSAQVLSKQRNQFQRGTFRRRRNSADWFLL